MTIVCATAFTDSSFSALKVAAALAKRHRQPLWLVNVLRNNVISKGAEAAEAHAKEALQLEAAALRADGVETQTAVLHGALERAVGQFCTEKEALLLVVGDTNHPHSPLLTGPLDKFAYGVETPLLVVRDPKPFQAWAEGTAPLKVMLALDHTWSSAVARDWILRLSEYGPIDLVASHIWWPLTEYERRGLTAPGPEEGHLALSALMRDETEAALKGLPTNVKHRVHLEMGRGHIGEQLLALATEEQVDVLVLGTHPHRGPLKRLWSVSQDVLELAPMSVACVPGRMVLPGISTQSPAQAPEAAHFSTIRPAPHR
jgi:nucleotide-binding universal stress UspA family protein